MYAMVIKVVIPAMTSTFTFVPFSLSLNSFCLTHPRWTK